MCAKKKTRNIHDLFRCGTELYSKDMICCNLRGKNSVKIYFLVEQWLCLFFLWCEYVLFFFFKKKTHHFNSITLFAFNIERQHTSKNHIFFFLYTFPYFSSSSFFFYIYYFILMMVYMVI